MSLGRDFFHEIAKCQNGHELDLVLKKYDAPRTPARKMEAGNLIGKIVGARFDPYPVIDHHWFGSTLFTGDSTTTTTATVEDFLKGEENGD